VATVYRRADGEAGTPQPVWSTALTCHSVPLIALLSSDGEHLVTLGDFFDAHREPRELLAFYGRAGQVRRYTSEEGPDRLDPARFPQTCPPRPFPRPSGSSDEHNLVFLHEPAEQRPLLGMWLGLDNRWLAWDVASGAPILTDNTGVHMALVDAGRRHAIESFRTGHGRVASLRLLGTLRDPADRAVVEAQLRDASFTTGTAGGDSYSPVGYLRAHSHVRDVADVALRAWDERPRRGRYAYLGQVHGAVAPPWRVRTRYGTGRSLHVYLIPEDVPADEWARSRPVHRLISHFGVSRSAFGSDVRVRIDGVEPGRYWVKAVWRRAIDRPVPPWMAGEQPDAPLLRDGDLESVDRPPVVVTAGGWGAFDTVRQWAGAGR
jgi:hypothetical protein